MGRRKFEGPRGIYAIRNSKDGKVYVGQSKNVFARWAAHRYNLRRGSHKNPHLQAAWALYGEGSFVFELLEEVPEEESLPTREGHYCALFNSFDQNFGYNLDPVHPDGTKTGGRRSPEVRARMGEFARAREEARRAAGIPHFMEGRRLPPEVCARLSESRQSFLRNNPEWTPSPAFFQNRVPRPIRGPLSPETRKKLSEAAIAWCGAPREPPSGKGRPMPQEVREKIRASKLGVPRSEELKEKLRAHQARLREARYEILWALQEGD